MEMILGVIIRLIYMRLGFVFKKFMKKNFVFFGLEFENRRYEVVDLYLLCLVFK